MDANLLILILLSCLGFVMHVIAKFIDKKENKPKKFSLKFWWSHNKWQIILSLLSMIVIYLIADELGNAFGIILEAGSLGQKTVAFLGGYCNYELIQAMSKLRK